MTTAQVVETSVTVTNSSFQSYTHPDDHTRQATDTPGFKPFTMFLYKPGQVHVDVAKLLSKQQHPSFLGNLPGYCTNGEGAAPGTCRTTLMHCNVGSASLYLKI